MMTAKKKKDFVQSECTSAIRMGSSAICIIMRDDSNLKQIFFFFYPFLFFFFTSYTYLILKLKKFLWKSGGAKTSPSPPAPSSPLLQR